MTKYKNIVLYDVSSKSVELSVPKELKPWGVRYHLGISHAKNYGCQNPECGWDMIVEADNYAKYAVGFSLDNPRQSSLPDKIVGVLIFECPKCFEKFWVHATADWYELMSEGRTAEN